MVIHATGTTQDAGVSIVCTGREFTKVGTTSVRAVRVSVPIDAGTYTIGVYEAAGTGRAVDFLAERAVAHPGAVEEPITSILTSIVGNFDATPVPTTGAYAPVAPDFLCGCIWGHGECTQCCSDTKGQALHRGQVLFFQCPWAGHGSPVNTDVST